MNKHTYLLFFIFAITGLTPAACIKYDDSDLYSKYNNLDNRLSKLETLCQTINKDIASLRTIITALEQNDGIVSVEELYENESVVGYRIKLKSGGSFTIYNGKPGSPGKDADPTPTIGIRQDTDGLWYWTLDGTWLTDDSGNRIIASGQNGKDGITPKLRIVEGYWQISYDSGVSWTTIGKARGEDGQSVFAGINTDSQDYVVIKMTDNTSITLPRYKAISLKINGTEGITVSPGNTREITYAIEGASEDVQIETIAEGVKATVVKTDAFSGKIKVSIGETHETLEEGAKVLVFVVDKGQTVMRKLTFENSIITVTENTASGISYAGGIFNIDLMTNANIEILIPSEASSWISLPSATKSIEHIQRSVVVAPNEGLSRSVTITIKDRFNPVSKDITIFQSEHPDFYESTDYSMNGTWKKLQTAKTDGNGLNIVFLGDAYTDTMIEDGRYDSDMQRAMEHFFEVEPYASMRDMFNCYQVYAVSKNNNYKEGSSTAFRCQFGSGTHITGYADKVRMYAQKVSEIKNGKPDSSWYTFIEDELYTHYSDIPGGMLCIVVLNSTRYAGTCSIFTDGTAVAYCPLHERDDWFAEVIHHEACGHGFARLADEYDDYYDSLSDSRRKDLLTYQGYGFYHNIDITDEPESIRWSHFLTDNRYSNDTGIYEGAYLCNTGVWRPSKNSIMRYNTGGFNAPSREIIYRRAMELSKGSSYTYDFEDFASFDAKNRNTSTSAIDAKAITKSTRPLVPYSEPKICVEILRHDRGRK